MLYLSTYNVDAFQKPEANNIKHLIGSCGTLVVALNIGKNNLVTVPVVHESPDFTMVEAWSTMYTLFKHMGDINLKF